MNQLDFSFSDLISGYVASYDRAQRCIKLNTSDGRAYAATLTANTYARQTQTLHDGWPDRGGQLEQLLVPGQMVFLYGTFFPESQTSFEVNYVVFAGESASDHRHLEQGW